MTIVCGDSHTATHGAFGSLAFGIGTSEVEHVLATQTLVQAKAKRLSPVAHAFLGFIRSERVQISALAERFAGRPRVPANEVPGSH